MDFKVPYLLAMREQAPKMFMELRRSGRLEQFLQQKSHEAHQLLREILAKHQQNEPPSLQQKREAEEQVFGLMIEFLPEQKPEFPEPPEDLPGHPGEQGRLPNEYRTLMSRVATTASSRAH
jgi:hypothetical protein